MSERLFGKLMYALAGFVLTLVLALCVGGILSAREHNEFVDAHNFVYVGTRETAELQRLYADGWQFRQAEFGVVTLAKKRPE